MAKADNKIRDPRVIYISWLSGEEEQLRVNWVFNFRNAVAVHTSAFNYPVGCTGDEEEGKFKRTEEFLKEVTDMVAVLTHPYILANRTQTAPAKKREFAQYIQLKDRKDVQRAWLTPLHKFNYEYVEVEGVKLSEDRCGFVRLKPSREQFPLPGDPKSDDEIFEAVQTILGEHLAGD